MSFTNHREQQVHRAITSMEIPYGDDCFNFAAVYPGLDCSHDADPLGRTLPFPNLLQRQLRICPFGRARKDPDQPFIRSRRSFTQVFLLTQISIQVIQSDPLTDNHLPSWPSFVVDRSHIHRFSTSLRSIDHTTTLDTILHVHTQSQTKLARFGSPERRVSKFEASDLRGRLQSLQEIHSGGPRSDDLVGALSQKWI